MRHVLALSVLLSVFWLINSGHYTPQLLFFMLISVLFVAGLCQYMDVVDGESQPLSITFTLPIYLVWLAKEVILANIAVARCVWQGSESINPRVLRVTAHQNTDLGRVIYANSITLTPGTVSIDLEGKEIVVHALNDASADDLLTGEMDRRVCRVEG
jgi:multicomponent Na+:H+ antiporter subunit E